MSNYGSLDFEYWQG